MGVIWAIVWFLVVKNSPSEDPNISEEELLFIENSLANDVQKKVQCKCVYPEAYHLGDMLLVYHNYNEMMSTL